MSALADRRQRAREAYYDGIGAFEAALEVATQVKITGDVVETMYQAMGCTMWPNACQELLKMALEAAGFEVVE